jgi:hypothetical protein
MKLSASILAIAILTSCGSKPVVDKPATGEIVGVWECSDFPSGFLAKAGVDAGSQRSRIVIREDGTCSASNMPQRSPYRFIEVPNSSWTLTDPSMTPSGAWSVEFDGHLLQFRRAGDRLELGHLISGKEEYSVEYKRAEQDGARQPASRPESK